MTKKNKIAQFTDAELATIARQFRRAFGDAPFRQSYSDEPTFQQRLPSAKVETGRIWRRWRSQTLRMPPAPERTMNAIFKCYQS